MQEIAILKECDSALIVRYHGSFQKDNDFWIAMEYCNAGSVADLMEATGAPLASEDLISAVIFFSVQGLAYLHSLRRIHR